MQKHINTNFNGSRTKKVALSGKMPTSKRTKYILSGVAAFSAAFCVAYVASAEFMRTSSTDAATNVSAAISSNGYYLNVTSLGEVNIDVDATAEGGVGQGSDRVQVETNTAAYRLYISTTDNSNAMFMNGDSTSTYKLNATSEGANLATNSWGYKLSTDTNFKPVPVKGSEALLVHQTGLTANTANTREHAVVYGAKADMTVPAGRYSRTVVYSALADASVQTNLASVSPGEVERASSGTFTLTVSLPMMTNMEAGTWTVKIGTNNCTSPTATKTDNGINITCTAPKTLTAGTYTVTATSNKYGVTYTASNALKYIVKDLFSITEMQQMTSDICANTKKPAASATSYDTNGSHRDSDAYIPQWTLTDTRTGNKKYVIQKMPDGKCWMAQNLALDGGQTLTSEKSNVPSDWPLPAAGSGATSSSNNVAEVRTGSHTDGNVSSNGNWYTFQAATAGNGSGKTGDGDIVTAGDICPSNWRLPNGGSSGEFQALYNYYNNKSKLDAVWHPVYAGYYTPGGFYSSGSYGYWWSRTSTSSSNAYLLVENTSGGINPASNYSRYGAFSVRCVAQ